MSDGNERRPITAKTRSREIPLVRRSVSLASTSIDPLDVVAQHREMARVQREAFRTVVGDLADRAADIEFAPVYFTLFPNFPGPWVGYPLRDRVADGLGMPVACINDARAHTLAEARMGAGRGAPTIAMLTLGTGIGGGLVIDGKLHLGSSGTAGEIGHQTVHDGGRRCGCGNLGCAEPYAQAGALMATAGRDSVEAVLMLRRSTQTLVSSSSERRLTRIALTKRRTSVMVRFSRTFIGAIVPRSARSAGTKATPVAMAWRGW